MRYALFDKRKNDRIIKMKSYPKRTNQQPAIRKQMKQATKKTSLTQIFKPQIMQLGHGYRAE